MQINEVKSDLTKVSYVPLKNASINAVKYTIELREIILFKQRVVYALALFFSLMCFSLSFKLHSESLKFQGFKRRA